MLYVHLSLVEYYLSIFRLLCSVEFPVAFVADPLRGVVAEVGQGHPVLGAVITKDPPTGPARMIDKH